MTLTYPQNSNIAIPAYDIDKIVGIYEGSFNAVTQTTQLTYNDFGSPAYVWVYEIPHSFTRPVFCELLPSTDNNTWTNNANIAWSDSSKIYIYAGISFVINTPPVGIIYYRLVASWITGYDTSNPVITPVIQGTSGLYYSSVQNTQKIYKQDVVTLANNSSQTIAHGLGYYPNCKVFMECFSGQVWPCHTGSNNDLFDFDQTMNTGYFNMTTNELNIFCDQNATAFGGSRFWYRIYEDS